jgi:hypothetical protein
MNISETRRGMQGVELRKSITFLVGSQSSPARPYDRNSMKIKANMKTLERWSWWLEIRVEEFLFVVKAKAHNFEN